MKKLKLFMVKPGENRQEGLKKLIAYLKQQGIKIKKSKK
tara:strand:+ start:1334 stop:1450 length:117 start_codon:yes stop_codon:yes gene_type:complete